MKYRKPNFIGDGAYHPMDGRAESRIYYMMGGRENHISNPIQKNKETYKLGLTWNPFTQKFEKFN